MQYDLFEVFMYSHGSTKTLCRKWSLWWFLDKGVWVLKNKDSWFLPRFYKLLNEYMNGRISPTGGRKGKHQPTSEKMLYARRWLRKFKDQCGDKMPNVVKICLPSCLTRREVYEIYSLHMAKTGHHKVSVRGFLEMWRRDFPDVIIPKVMFSMCSQFIPIFICLRRLFLEMWRWTYCMHCILQTPVKINN